MAAASLSDESSWITPVCKLQILYRGTSVRKSLDGISPSHNVHERYAWYLPHSPAKVFIASGDNIALVGSDSIDQAVIRIRPFMSA
jgi:hypothetical protein